MRRRASVLGPIRLVLTHEVTHESQPASEHLVALSPAMGDVTVPVGKLLLDELNPRHRPVTTQEAALAQILRRAPSKLVNLAEDIAQNGLSPIDRPIVMKAPDGKKYIVLEGNRRLAAVRLLHKPQLCPDPGLRPKFESIAQLAAQKPARVRAFEVASREEARPLLDRRHGGEMDGIGVVRWSAMQRTRNSTSPGHQERAALTTLDWLDGKSQAGANQELADLLDEVAEGKFTTFGRLAGDPDFRAYAGYEIRGDVFTPADSSENIVIRLSLVLDDFRGQRGLTVTELKRKPQREEYIKGLRKRMVGADESDVEPDEDPDDDTPPEPPPTGGAEPAPADSPSPADDAGGGDEPEDKPPAMKLFVGTSLSNGSLRLRRVLDEVQRIPLNRYPNSAGALIRMVIELAVREAHDVCAWPSPPQQAPTLRHWVLNAIHQLDPTMKAQRYLGLRQQINQKDSLISTETLNAFLHSPTYVPSAPAMRTISDTYSVLLTDLNRVMGDARDADA
jgi:hypothetical protein